jgi:hypothetical protein
VLVCGIDDLAAEYGAPVAVKLDIEGLELSALESSRVISEGRSVLYTEICPAQLQRYGRSVHEFSAFLRSLNYRLFRNLGDRNASNDRFWVGELLELSDVNAELFDVLAVPSDSPRLSLVAMAEG